jgi:DNA-binding XRE family transcriptional regulator
MAAKYMTTPGGEELAFLPRAELDALEGALAELEKKVALQQEALEHEQAVSEYRAGRLPGLSPDEAMAFADAVSPLAFWRKRAELTQAALAERIGVAQNYLSEVESSKRTGRIGLWLKLSAALGVPVEALVDEG